MIALLDLNYTLVENSRDQDYNRPFRENLAIESYRPWLVEAVQKHFDKVILVTVRWNRHEQATLDRIRTLTGWQPDEAIFNWPPHLRAPDHKQRALHDRILPRYGDDLSLYLALESNPKTRAMYAAEGVRAIPCEAWAGEIGAEARRPRVRDVITQAALF